MQNALFGKLRSKRDFVAVGCPRGFLSVFEPWIQGCMSSSRMTLELRWQEAFLTSPIWRFWLGSELCGVPVMGAMMPSMDGIGRYFPLTLVAIPGGGETLLPPEFDACDPWFQAVEDYLLATLADGESFEAVTAGLQRLPAAPSVAAEAGPAALAPALEAGFAETFSQLRRENAANACAASTFWWTVGGEGFPALALSSLRMPDAQIFSGMLTGDFGPPDARGRRTG